MSGLEDWDQDNKIIHNAEEINSSKGDEISLENRDGYETKHEVLWSLKTSAGVHPEYGEFWTCHQIVRCKGTDQITYRETSYTQEFDFTQIGPDDFVIDEHPCLYPPRGGLEGRLDANHLEPGIRRVYKEVIDAVNADMLILSAMGLRVLVEQICKTIGSNKGTLYDKLGDLKTKGTILTSEYDVLICLKNFGNDAAHKVEPIPKRKLRDAFRVVENYLERFVIHPAQFPNNKKEDSKQSGQ